MSYQGWRTRANPELKLANAFGVMRKRGVNWPPYQRPTTPRAPHFWAKREAILYGRLYIYRHRASQGSVVPGPFQIYANFFIWTGEHTYPTLASANISLA